MRVCIAGSYDPQHTRTRTIRAALEELGHEVSEAPSGRGHLVRRSARTLRRLARDRGCDVIVVLYPAWGIALPVALFGLLRRRPVAVDAYLSIYESWWSDEKRSRMHQIAALVIEAALVRLTTILAMDTREGADALAARAGVAPHRVQVWPIASSVGLEVDGAAPRFLARDVGERRTVIWYGNPQPLNGFDVLAEGVARAARARADLTVRVVSQSDQLARRLESHAVSVVYKRPMPLKDLLREIAAADLALGVFGSSAKADHVVPNKVADALSLGTPVVTARTPALVALPEDPGLVLVERDPAEIASSIAGVLLEDEVSATDRRRSCAQLAQSFTVEVVAAAIDRAFVGAAIGATR
jgi:glycosyltransferase involved in cell wall biosynthesis